MPEFTPPSWTSPVPDGHRVVFVLGLHRSATTLLADLLSRHPDCSGFEGTDAPMDEGQYLQTVMRRPDGGVLDNVGSLALKPRNRLTERAPEATEANAQKLWREWAPHWDLNKPVLVEKSPGNLTKMRFLAALFPGSRFVVISRHPVAQAMAIRKWAGNRPSLQHVANWVAAYRLARADAAALPGTVLLRYEDLCAAPGPVFDRLLEALELRPGVADPGALQNSNPKYFAAWRARRESALFRTEDATIRTLLSGEPQRWGYDLHPDRLEETAPASVPGLIAASPA